MVAEQNNATPSSADTKPRVLHVGPLPPPFGGMATYVERFLRSAVTEAFDVRHIRSDLVNKYVVWGIRRQVLNLVNGLLLSAVFCWSLMRFWPAIVHVQTNSFRGFYEKSVLTLMARVVGRKVIMHPQGGGFRVFYERSPRPLRRLIRRCLNLNHRVVALSGELRQVFLDIGVAPERIVVLENAVFVPATNVWDPNDVARAGDGRSAKTVVVLFLNRVTVEKGILELIEAAGEIRDRRPELRFRIAGSDTPDARTARELVAQHGLTERIEFLGPVPEEAKDAVFLAADVYVLPSHVEGMPIGLLEAMSFGLPCIVTRVGGVPSVVEDGVNGLLVPVKDSGALAAAIEKLAADPALRRRLGTNARKTIDRRFNWDTRAAEIIHLYNSLL